MSRIFWRKAGDRWKGLFWYGWRPRSVEVYPDSIQDDHFMTLCFWSLPISRVDFATVEKAKAYAEEALSSPEAMKQAVADSRGDNWVITPPVGPWQGFGSHVHTGPAAALCRDGRSRGGSSKGSGGGGLLRSSS